MSFYLPKSNHNSIETHNIAKLSEKGDWFERGDAFFTGSLLRFIYWNQVYNYASRLSSDQIYNIKQLKSHSYHFGDIDIVLNWEKLIRSEVVNNSIINSLKSRSAMSSMTIYGIEVEASQSKTTHSVSLNDFPKAIVETLPMLSIPPKKGRVIDALEVGPISPLMEKAMVKAPKRPLNIIFCSQNLFDAWKFTNTRFLSFMGREGQLGKTRKKQFRVGFHDALMSMYLNVQDYS